MIDLLNIQENVVKKDLTNYKILLYGEAGVGKSTTASKFPKPLFFATELGYLAIPGVKAVNIKEWPDILTAVAQLRKPEVKEMYSNIVIDTVDELVALLSDFILRSEGAKKPSDLAYGQFYTRMDGELRKIFRQITAEGYGLVLIGHAKVKVFDDESQFAGQKYYEPSLDKRSKKIVDGLVDLQGLITREFEADGTPKSIINFQSTAFISAKSRFPKIAPRVPLSYENLLQAVLDAIELQEKETGKKAEDGKHNFDNSEPTEDDFKQIQNEALQLAKKLIDANDTQFVSDNMQSVLGCKISEASISDYSSLVALVNIFKNR